VGPSFPLRLQPHVRNALKGIWISAHKKSAIVKTDRNPAVLPELYNLCDLTLQRRLGSPREGFSDQSDPIANFENGFQLRFLVHLPFAFSPSSTMRQSVEQPHGESNRKRAERPERGWIFNQPDSEIKWMGRLATRDVVSFMTRHNNSADWLLCGDLKGRLKTVRGCPSQPQQTS